LVDDIWKGLGEQGSFQPVTEQLEWRRWCDIMWQSVPYLHNQKWAWSGLL